MTVKVDLPFSQHVSGSRFAAGEDLVWDADSKPGVRVATLYRHDASGEYTAIVDMDPGTDYAPHTHDLLEEVYVISGEFFDSENAYRAGDYVIRAAGAVHTTGADTACRVLVTYRRT